MESPIKKPAGKNRVFAFVTVILMTVVILYALYLKGDVRAGLRGFGIELSLETKQRTP